MPDPPGEDCEGFALEVGGALDLDLSAVRVSGQLTVNGMTMPDWNTSRGQIRFENLDEGTAASYELGSSGAASYELMLAQGSYEVSFVGNSAACSADPAPAFPCNAGVLIDAIELSADGALDLDVSLVSLSGTVTVNGAAMPSESSIRGQLGFRGPEGEVLGDDFGTSGAATYAINLVPGTYDLMWVGNSALCDDTPASAVPCNRALVVQDLDLGASGSLDLDVPAVTVSGEVTIDGAAMPTESSERGELRFVNGYGDVSTDGFGSSGAGTYSITLVADDYEIVWSGRSELCAEPSGVPCNTATIRTGQSLQQSGGLDLDVPSARVTGSVLVNGASMGDEAGSRGSLSFTGVDGRAVLSDDFGSTGPVTYGITLVAGTYAVGLAGNPALCDGNGSVQVPCMSGTIIEDIGLTQDGGLDIDIPAARISGTVLVNGQAMPAWTSERGSLSFSRSDGPDAGSSFGYSNDFGSSGAAEYFMTVIAGSYDVGWRAGLGTCAEEAAPVPCVDGPVLDDIALGADGSLDVDIERITISGQVLLEGATLPDDAADRGQLSFRHVDGGYSQLPGLGTTGAAPYAISLLPANYVVAHIANSGLCGEGDSPSVPCGSQVVLGCEP